MKKLLSLLLVLAMILGCFAACGKKAEEPQPSKPENTNAAAEQKADPSVKYKEKVVLTYSSEPSNGAPYFRVATADRIITNPTHDTLAVYNFATNTVDLKLAKSVTDVNKDGLTWDVEIQQGVKFHDGEGKAYAELKASDVKFTFEYAGINGTGNCGYTLGVLAKIDSIEVLDDYKLRFNLNTALYDFPFYLTGDAKMLCEKAFTEFKNGDDDIKAQEVGCGPYYLNYKETMPGSKWTLTRFEDYWQGLDNYPTKTFEFRLLTDANTYTSAVQAGEVDLVVSFSAEQANQLEGTGYSLLQTPGASNTFFGFNFHNFFREEEDLKLRQAIAYAIDKDALAAVYYAASNGKGGVVSNNFAASAIPGYIELENQYPADLAKAQSIMKELGYSETNRLKLRLAHYESYRKIAEIVQAQLKEAYIDIEPDLIDGSNFATYLRGGEGWDVCLNYASMGGAMFYDFDRFLQSQGSTRGLYGWESAEYDKLQEEAMNAGSYEAMGKKFAEIQKWVAQNLAYLPLVIGNSNYAVADGMVGVDVNPNLQLFNFATLALPEK